MSLSLTLILPYPLVLSPSPSPHLHLPSTFFLSLSLSFFLSPYIISLCHLPIPLILSLPLLSFCTIPSLSLSIYLTYQGMVKAVTGSYVIEYHPEGPEKPDIVWKVDFTPPFKRLDIISELEKALGVKLPPADTFHTPGQCTMVTIQWLHHNTVVTIQSMILL